MDSRWRPFFPQDHTQYIPLLTLKAGGRDTLGDAIAYAEPRSGGRVLYIWFALLETPNAEAILSDVFTFAAGKLN